MQLVELDRITLSIYTCNNHNRYGAPTVPQSLTEVDGVAGLNWTVPPYSG